MIIKENKYNCVIESLDFALQYSLFEIGLNNFDEFKAKFQEGSIKINDYQDYLLLNSINLITILKCKFMKATAFIIADCNIFRQCKQQKEKSKIVLAQLKYIQLLQQAIQQLQFKEKFIIKIKKYSLIDSQNAEQDLTILNLEILEMQIILNNQLSTNQNIGFILCDQLCFFQENTLLTNEANNIKNAFLLNGSRYEESVTLDPQNRVFKSSYIKESNLKLNHYSQIRNYYISRKNADDVEYSWQDLEYNSTTFYKTQEKNLFVQKVQNAKAHAESFHYDIEKQINTDQFYISLSKNNLSYYCLVYPINTLQWWQVFPNSTQNRIIMYVGRVQRDLRNILQAYNIFEDKQSDSFLKTSKINPQDISNIQNKFNNKFTSSHHKCEFSNYNLNRSRQIQIYSSFYKILDYEPMFEEIQIISQTFYHLQAVINYKSTLIDENANFINSILHFARARKMFQTINNTYGQIISLAKIGYFQFQQDYNELQIIKEEKYDQVIELLDFALKFSLYEIGLNNFEEFKVKFLEGLIKINGYQDYLLINSINLIIISKMQILQQSIQLLQFVEKVMVKLKKYSNLDQQNTEYDFVVLKLDILEIQIILSNQQNITSVLIDIFSYQKPSFLEHILSRNEIINLKDTILLNESKQEDSFLFESFKKKLNEFYHSYNYDLIVFIETSEFEILRSCQLLQVLNELKNKFINKNDRVSFYVYNDQDLISIFSLIQINDYKIWEISIDILQAQLNRICFSYYGQTQNRQISPQNGQLAYQIAAEALNQIVQTNLIDIQTSQ
ncbi:hypothetical protein ABPG72_014901 [Tetrahymena utriculariae]